LANFLKVLTLSGRSTSPVYASEDRLRPYDKSLLWKNVHNKAILDFLSDYETEKSARLANSRLWISYIREQLEENGDLRQWNVALVNGDDNGRPFTVGGMEITGRVRRPDILVNQNAGYRIKRLVTNRDVGIDLDDGAWDRARGYDPTDPLSGDPLREPTSQANCLVRENMGLNPLLLVYLPQAEEYGSLPIVGVAIAFPGSEKTKRKAVRYTVNAVYIEESMRGEEVAL
jgi:hypothetical protein